jgi:iron complex transport system ATP-binding protein
MAMTAAIHLDGVSFSYPMGFALSLIDLRIEQGEMVAVLGPNGSGKTTLLKLMLGLLQPRTGEVRFNDRPLGAVRRRELARSIAMVPQEVTLPFTLTAAEVGLLGRTPYLGRFRGPTQEDREAVRAAMAATDVLALSSQPYNALSGGERQRVVLAMALSQDPQLLLLDEPTRHLDLSHQLRVLSLIRRFNRSRGLTVVSAMHDLNLCALYFDRLILLSSGQVVADGPPEKVIQPDLLKEVFGVTVRVEPHPTRDIPWTTILPDTP